MRILLSILAITSSMSLSAPEPLTLTLGDTIAVEGADLTLTFAAVPRDSRCPRDVNCIVAGEAIVILEATHAGTETELTFKIPPGGQDEQSLDAFTISITTLEPETNSTKKIDPSDYTATITVTTP